MLENSKNGKSRNFIELELIKAFRERYPAVNFDFYTATADHIKVRMDRGYKDVK